MGEEKERLSTLESKFNELMERLKYTEDADARCALFSQLLEIISETNTTIQQSSRRKLEATDNYLARQ